MQRAWLPCFAVHRPLLKIHVIGASAAQEQHRHGRHLLQYLLSLDGDSRSSRRRSRPILPSLRVTTLYFIVHVRRGSLGEETDSTSLHDLHC